MTDTERLEWIVANGGAIQVMEGVKGFSVFDTSNGLALLGLNVDMREAIDQAMTGGGECLFSRPTTSSMRC